MKVGTKSVLFGAHQFLLHPLFVAWAWWRLYGFPWDPRLWVAFYVHDLGYWGKPNMDGPEGERHVEIGARLMSWLFDRRSDREEDAASSSWIVLWHTGGATMLGPWGLFTLCHSRYYAKQIGRPYSRLCVADKLAFVLTPAWIYLPMARASGELDEYLRNAGRGSSPEVVGWNAAVWHGSLREYLTRWCEEHRDGKADEWTPLVRP